MSKDWDWQKLSFILEEQGKVQDDEISKAQSRTNSALLNSLQAGYSLFTTNLENDELSFKRWQLASSGDEAKARAAVVASLEELGFKNKFGGKKSHTQTCRQFITNNIIILYHNKVYQRPYHIIPKVHPTMLNIWS